MENGKRQGTKAMSKEAVSDQATMEERNPRCIESMSKTEVEDRALSDEISTARSLDHGLAKDCKKGGSSATETNAESNPTSDALIHQFKEEVNPLPMPSPQPRHLQQVPGAFAVVSPFHGPTSARTLCREASETSIMTEAMTEAATSGLFNLPATLSPEEGSHLDAEGGNAGGIHTHSNDMVLEAKIVEEEDEGQSRRRYLLLSLMLILVSIVIALAVGLAASHERSKGDINKQADPLSVSKPDKPTSLLEQIRDRGYLKCHYINVPGFMSKNESTGQVTGFHSVWCKAIAAALFGLDNLEARIKYIDFFPFNTDADVSAVGITPTMSRHVYFDLMKIGMSFSAPVLYDGIRFAGDPFFVDCAQDFHHLDECEDLMVCVQTPSTHHAFLQKVLPVRRVVTFPGLDEAMRAFSNGDVCNVIATKEVLSPEAVLRSWGYQGNFTIGDNMFSHEQWSLVTRKGDARWRDFVNAVVHSVLVAEQENITRATSYLFPQTQLFGEEYKDMFRNSVAAVGNLEEIYGTSLSHLPRSAVNQINDGSTGLMYSYPFGLSSTRSDATYPLGPRLEQVRSSGKLRCGVRFNRQGFAETRNGTSMGMEVDLCKGLAASLFGTADALELIELSGPSDGFQRLAKEQVDVIAGALWNLENEVKEPTTGTGYSFSQPYYYHGPGGGYNLCLATLEDDDDWATFVFWYMTATIFAEEEGINQTTSNDMPLIPVFGSGLRRMARDGILAVGNYEEIYQRNVQALIPRSGRNLLNANAQGPQHYPMPGLTLL